MTMRQLVTTIYVVRTGLRPRGNRRGSGSDDGRGREDFKTGSARPSGRIIANRAHAREEEAGGVTQGG